MPPETLPLFPLAGVLLLPGGQLPLNIFEPRYLNMTDAALDGDGMIGMVQPLNSDLVAAIDPIPDDAMLYDVGCAGRITSFAETDDGRYLIALSGVSRFRIVEEMDQVGGFRLARAGYRGFASDLEEDTGGVDRSRLLEAVKAFLGAHDLEADWAELKKTPDDALVTSLAMTLPLEPSEKQALLEAAGLKERAALLTSLLDMAARQAKSPSNAVRH